MIHPWLQDTWTRLVELGERLPHALLFVGPPGLGKHELVEALAARLLCDAPTAAGHACGRCTPCQWRLASNHPDLHYLVPAADLVADGAEGEGADPNAKEGKAKSAQIVIEQVRDLQTSLSVTGHHSSRRVVVLDPAEAMNVFTANALLKLLEAPPLGCVFLLLSSAPRRLLPTIRSRCQQWSFSRPPEDVLQPWKAKADAQLLALLALAGGMPLAAERMAATGVGALLARFVRDVSALQATDALRVAAQWEAWLKSREALAAGFGLPELCAWMHKHGKNQKENRNGRHTDTHTAATVQGSSSELSQWNKALCSPSAPIHTVCVGRVELRWLPRICSIRARNTLPASSSANCTPTPWVLPPCAPSGVIQTTRPATGCRVGSSISCSSMKTSSPKV